MLYVKLCGRKSNMKKNPLLLSLLFSSLLTIGVISHVKSEFVEANAASYNHGEVTISSIAPGIATNSVEFYSTGLDDAPYDGGWSYVYKCTSDNAVLFNGNPFTGYGTRIPFYKLGANRYYVAIPDINYPFSNNDTLIFNGELQGNINGDIHTFTLNPVPIKYNGASWQLYDPSAPVVEEPETIDVSISPDVFKKSVGGNMVITTNNDVITLMSTNDDPFLTFTNQSLVYLAAFSTSVSMEYMTENVTKDTFITDFRFYEISGTSNINANATSSWTTLIIPCANGGEGNPGYVRWDVFENHAVNGTFFHFKNFVIHDVPVDKFVEMDISSNVVKTDSSQGNNVSIALNTASRGTVGSYSENTVRPFSVSCYSITENKRNGLAANIKFAGNNQFIISFPDIQYFMKNNHQYRLAILKNTIIDGNVLFISSYIMTATFNDAAGVYSLTNLNGENEEDAYENAEQEFTHNGLFTITKNSSNYGYTLYTENDSTSDIPEGFHGAVLKTVQNSNASLALDFSNSKIPINLIESIDYRFYTAESNPSSVKPEFRLQVGESGPWIIGQGDGGIRYMGHINEWYKLSIDSSSWRSGYSFASLEDPNNPGYLGSFNTRFRTNSSCYNYVDYINLNLKGNDYAAPVISSDFDETVVVNVGEDLPVFATAFDVQENRNITVEYYYTGFEIINNKINTIGEYEIVAFAYDYYGNTSYKKFDLVILEPDEIAPVINIPFDELNIPAGTIAAGLEFDQYISDNSGRVKINITYSEGAVLKKKFVAGHHTITIKATDYSNNSTTKIINVNVINNFIYDGTTIDEEAVFEEVRTFVKNYMHMEDYVENLGYCKDDEHHYYADAKAYYNTMSSNAKNLFYNHIEFQAAKARLSAWAIANGDELTSTQISANHNIANILKDNYFIYITAIIVGYTSVLLISSLLIKTKRKTNK